MAKHNGRRKKTPADPVVSPDRGAKNLILQAERPIPAGIYPVIDTDLGRDNIENDIPAADLQDL